jgi:hypothetical protein
MDSSWKSLWLLCSAGEPPNGTRQLGIWITSPIERDQQHGTRLPYTPSVPAVAFRVNLRKPRQRTLMGTKRAQ